MLCCAECGAAASVCFPSSVAAACRMMSVACCHCMLHVACFCCLLHVLSSLLHDACCMFSLLCCMLYVACCRLHVVSCLLSVACCLLHVACCLLPVLSSLLHVVCCHVACCLLHVKCCVLHVAWCRSTDSKRSASERCAFPARAQRTGACAHPGAPLGLHAFRTPDPHALAQPAYASLERTARFHSTLRESGLPRRTAGLALTHSPDRLQAAHKNDRVFAASVKCAHASVRAAHCPMRSQR
jgi:hypothetical protein